MGAPWRKNRRTTWDLLGMLRANGISPSPLLNAPWITTEIFRMDWLHCVDQGVGSTLLGCIFYITIRRKEVGRNITERTNAFWSRVQGPRLIYTSYHYVCMVYVCMVYVHMVYVWYIIICHIRILRTQERPRQDLRFHVHTGETK